MLVGRLVDAILPGGPGVALVSLANVLALVAAVLLHRLVLLETGNRAVARRAVWALSLFPPAFVLVWAYGEGLFLALAYFGTDQSQVQRYLTASSLRQSRLALIFNAFFKVPMQIFILMIGVLLYVFYHFERPPIVFNSAEVAQVATSPRAGEFAALEERVVVVAHAVILEHHVLEAVALERRRLVHAAPDPFGLVAGVAQDGGERMRGVPLDTGVVEHAVN